LKKREREREKERAILTAVKYNEEKRQNELHEMGRREEI
jgi:hypothetical protein